MNKKKIPILDLPYDAEAIFKSRPNRFLGIVDIIHPQTASDVKIHIHDPGRLKEILIPGTKLRIKHVNSSNRKTEWDAIAAQHNKHWVLIHSGYHRQIAEQILNNSDICPFGKINKIKAEIKYEHSRLDFLIEKDNKIQVWIEVKGCTLADKGKALFPDAPTKRGTKHLNTLISIKEKGGNSAMLILIFISGVKYFAPHKDIDPVFASTFYKAVNKGVEVFPLVLEYKDNAVYYLNNACLEPSVKDSP